MKKLSAEDIRNLVNGDKVYRFSHGESRRLFFVGIMPQSENTFVFCDGTYLTYLHISPKDDSFSGEWYDGSNYDSKFIGNKMIEYYERRIEDVRSIYLKEK